jgi:hypothetical protein
MSESSFDHEKLDGYGSYAVLRKSREHYSSLMSGLHDEIEKTTLSALKRFRDLVRIRSPLKEDRNEAVIRTLDSNMG